MIEKFECPKCNAPLPFGKLTDVCPGCGIGFGYSSAFRPTQVKAPSIEEHTMHGHGNTQSKANFWSTTSLLIAIGLGIPLWWLLLGLLHGTPIGSASNSDLVFILAPVIGIAAPIAISIFEHNPATAAWIVAMAPLLAPINFFLGLIVSSARGSSDLHIFDRIFLSVIWVLPSLIGHWLKAKNSPSNG